MTPCVYGVRVTRVSVEHVIGVQLSVDTKEHDVLDQKNLPTIDYVGVD